MKKSEITLKRTQTAVGTMANQLVTAQKTMGQEHNAVPAFAAIPRQSSGRSGYGCDNSCF